MAKGQKKSNKEIRKPKKDKSAAPVAPLPGTAVKSIPSSPFQQKAKK